MLIYENVTIIWWPKEVKKKNKTNEYVFDQDNFLISGNQGEQNIKKIKFTKHTFTFSYISFLRNEPHDLLNSRDTYYVNTSNKKYSLNNLM